MADPDAEVDELLRRARAGDKGAVEELLEIFRERLRQLLSFRLNRAVRARVDPSDVLQETLLCASQELPRYLEEAKLPFYVWMRQIAMGCLARVHRAHLETGMRSVRREAPAPDLGGESADALARVAGGSDSGVSGPLITAEDRARVLLALAELGPVDREVLELRYLEQLSMAEIAAVQGGDEGAARVRHFRALRKLQQLLGDGAGRGGSFSGT